MPIERGKLLPEVRPPTKFEYLINIFKAYEEQIGIKSVLQTSLHILATNDQTVF